MTQYDLESLLAPIGDDSPSGDDLEYDPEFLALERAAAPKAERAIGDNVKGGLYGQDPRINDLDSRGNAKVHVDHRSVYSSMLQGWLGGDDSAITRAWACVAAGRPDGRAERHFVDALHGIGRERLRSATDRPCSG